MPKFHGKLGYGDSAEVPPDSGIFVDVITERSFYGDVVQNRRGLREGENLNQDLSVSPSISIVADPYLRGNFTDIKYVEWAGKRWIVTDVEVQLPRLILRLGEVYNGPTPATP